MERSELLDPELMNRIEQLRLASRKVFLGRMKGERRSKRRGQSVEFADYRDYSPGDDLRFLDWNIFGRLERLFIKLFMEEEDLSVYIFLDTSESMRFGEPAKFDYARRLAAALGYIGLSSLRRLTASQSERSPARSARSSRRAAERSSSRACSISSARLSPAA
jgi:uncharacterized protein (DUF58 family)